MTKKYFQLIAAVVADITNTTNRRTVAERFADELARCNSRFDRQRFLDTCGVVSREDRDRELNKAAKRLLSGT